MYSRYVVRCRQIEVTRQTGMVKIKLVFMTLDDQLELITHRLAQELVRLNIIAYSFREVESGSQISLLDENLALPSGNNI